MRPANSEAATAAIGRASTTGLDTQAPHVDQFPDVTQLCPATMAADPPAAASPRANESSL
jgi:hypothetical protein